jgi:hypothetical protein
MYFEAVHTDNKSQHSSASLLGQASLRFTALHLLVCEALCIRIDRG